MLKDGPYNPTEEESKILQFWLQNKFYKPEYNPELDCVESTDKLIRSQEKVWCLICPPPNAYSRPHIGNISGYAYQDAMARFARMEGKRVLMIPGKDHAGLEGEAVFIREVLETQGKKKSDFSREDFYNQMMEFFQKNMWLARIDEQNIGLSADFDRDIFTLDPRVVDIVLDTFVEMYNKGMIYKGVRIVNWDPKAKTPVADNQVVFEEVQTPFFYFKYILEDVDQNAIELKNKYNKKLIKFNKERLDFQSSKEQEYSHLDYILHDKFKIHDTKICCIPLGFDENEIIKNEDFEGIVVGIEMRLDKEYRLVVAKPSIDLSIQNITKISSSLWQNLNSYQSRGSLLPAGSHFIIFDENDDHSYRNGFVIGTVRPETIFGDTAIACNPGDQRYSEYVGKTIEVEFLGKKKKINFISDYSVDIDFGSGLLKITPAHSVEDWEISQRHPKECLPPIQVINKDLKLNTLVGKEYEGLTISEARKKILLDMQRHGNLVFVDENYRTRIKIAERTKAPIEPILSSQWYLSYDVPVDVGDKSLRQAAIDMVKTREIKIHPKNMESKFYHWMENLRDWAISRTLWWGYRLPVWYHGEIKEIVNEFGQVEELIKLNGTNNWIKLNYKDSNHMRVQKYSPGDGWCQDESVLDTWFSSGQWVYATLMAFGLIEKFFPTDVMCSGFDILENWDSRMMMFTYFKTRKIPFKNLYLTGLVLGPDGQKMSKSRGNIVDIDKVRLEYGTDAVRLVYFYQNNAGANYSITYEKLKTFKQFCNKIWNAAKFVLKYSEYYSLDFNLDSADTELEFVNRVKKHIFETKKKIIKNIKNFQFGLATYNLYQDFWHVYCDLFIEESKRFLNSSDKNIVIIIASLMIEVFKIYLKLLHPFIPFITERIWQEMPKKSTEHRSIMFNRIN